MASKSKYIKMGILLLVIGAFTYFALSLNKGETAAGIGEKAYDFELESLDGEEVKLSQYAGQVTILNYFATWCGPCVDEAPELEAFEQEYGGDFKLLIIDLGETKDRVRKFINQHKTTSQYLFDYKQDVAKKYGVIGQPETFVIDKNGIIREHYKGPVTKNELYQMAAKYN
ncbi:TlpA disulfide reductase family protein [Bacillus sp. REN3]|uniref:TlpA family protein disulfide reductase n=1 Tax=Bacillus sp. REN3 TaxID=2802440 RepID=UPI001AEDAED7|nr:TlpA disulfide reductase family protein [Bacillus sp. REN3]